MEKSIELTFLYDIYGKLLTEKQRDIFELYYLSDLSLREIAENKNISYQAVRDSIKTSENMLKGFEDVVGMHKCKNRLNDVYELCVSERDLNQVKPIIISKLNELR